jgi:hypothetical protein
LFPVKQTKETISTSSVLEIVSDLQLEEKEKGAEILLEEVSLPPLEGITIDGILKAGDTLYESLIREGISAAEILDLQEKIKSVVDCNYIPAGSRYSLKYDPTGTIKEFTYEPTPFDIFHISLPNSDSEDLKVVKEDIPKEIVQMEGTIKSSLYESMLECADSPQLAIQMAEIFAWQIDFLTECREGDTFKILVEKQYKGDFYRWEKILAAQYEGELLSKHDAVLFEDPSGDRKSTRLNSSH